MATDALPAVEGPLVQAWHQLGARLNALALGAKLTDGSKAFIQAQLREVEGALAAVTRMDGQWTATALPEAYGRSSAAASLSLTDEGVSPGPANLGGIDRRALRALVERISGDLLLTRAALIEGLALGDPRRSVRSVLDALEGDNQLIRMQGGKLSVKTPSGKMWDAEAYARMLSRTVIADARRVAFRQRYLSNGIDLVKVVANGTTHTVCRVWERETLSLTGAVPGFPTVDQARAAGLFHPHCRHRYVVDVDALVENPNQVARGAAVVPEGPLPILGRQAPRGVFTLPQARTPTTIRREQRRAARTPTEPRR